MLRPSAISTRRLDTTPIARLRLWRSGGAVLDALGSQIGAPWPVAPNARLRAEEGEIVWTAPDTWLLTEKFAERAPSCLAAALSDHLHHWSDLSAGVATYAVDGSLANEVIVRGCAIPAIELRLNNSAQTRFAKIGALLRRASSDRVLITVRSGFAGYLGAWLERAVEAVEAWEP